MKGSTIIHRLFFGLFSLLLLAACSAASTPTRSPLPPTALPGATADSGEDGRHATPTAISNSPTAPAPATRVPSGQAPLDQGALPAPVLAFAGDPHDPRGAYALLANYDLFYTNDRGLTWQALPFPPAGTGAELPLIGQPYPLAQPDLVAKSFRAGLLFARAGDSLYRSLDAGQTWEKLLDSVALFDVDYEGKELYAWRPDLPQEERGLYRSQDGGETWRRTYRGFFPPALRAAEERPETEGLLSLVIDPTFGNSLLVGTHFGVFRSFTGGALWEEFNTGLPSTADTTRRAPVLKVVGRDLYLLSETSDDSGQRMLFARLAHGEIIPDQDRWEEVGEPDLSRYTSPSQPGFHGVYDLADHQYSLYLATSGGVLASRDRGEHWELLPGVDGTVYRLGINPTSQEQLYTWMDGGLITVDLPSESAGPPALPTQPPVSGEASLRLLGSAGGALNGFALLDKIAVLGVGLRLETLDLTAPGGPSLIGRSDLLPGVPAALAAWEQMVYVAIPDSGLLVFDFSDPSQPVEIDRVELPFAARLLLQQDNRLFASGGFCQGSDCLGGLAVLDIADPRQPRLSGVLETPAQAVRLELSGGIAYLYEQACRPNGCKYLLRVFDVSDPSELPELAAPVELAVLEVPGPLVNLIIAGERLLLAHQNGLLVIDVSQPERPKQIGRLPLNISSFDLYDQYAYAAKDWEVHIIDLSDPDHPEQDGILSQEQFAFTAPQDGVIFKQRLYTLSSFGEFGHCWSNLHVFDLSDPAAPRPVSTEQDTLSFTCASQPSVYGDWLVLSDWKGVHFVDLSEPDRPRLHGSYPLTTMPFAPTVRDGYIYLGNGLASDSLLVIDAHAPAEPVLHGPFEFAWAYGIIRDEQYLYIPSWEAGLVVADLSDPARPEVVGGLGSVQLGGYPYRLAVDGDRLVVDLGEIGLRIVDISDAEDPVPLGRLDQLTGSSYIGADWLAAHGGYIYWIANLPEGVESAPPSSAPTNLVVIDERDPRNPVQVNQFEMPSGFRPAAMHVNNGRLLLAGNLCPGETAGCSGRFSVYDVSAPAEPVEISAVEFPFELKAMAEADEFAYLSAAPNLLLVLNVSDPANPTLAAQFQAPGCAGNLAVEGRRLYVDACEAGLLILEVEQ